VTVITSAELASIHTGGSTLVDSSGFSPSSPRQDWAGENAGTRSDLTAESWAASGSQAPVRAEAAVGSYSGVSTQQEGEERWQREVHIRRLADQRGLLECFSQVHHRSLDGLDHSSAL